MLRAVVLTALFSLALAAPASASEWAHPVNIVAIHARPDSNSKRVGTTRLLTEDKRAEVYLVLTHTGHDWVRIRIPGRPNGGKGWVRRSALGPFIRVDTEIRVDLRSATLTLTKQGKTLLRTRVGVGKASTPTPEGHFWVREKLRVKNAPVYGNYALGTAAYAKLSDWPGGRRRGHPRHQRAGPDPGTPEPRLHPRAQRGHGQALRAHAGRDADRASLRIDRSRTTSSASVL